MQTLALAAALEQAVYDRGLDKRLDFNKDPGRAQIAALDPQTIEDVLAFCLAEQHPAAARAAAEILGRDGEVRRICCGAEASRRRWSARCKTLIGGCEWPRWKRLRP